jgi:hypothetical protein
VQLSIRKYAQHRGVSHAVVQKAIRQGRIQLTSEGKVDVEQADRDWTRNTGPSTPRRRLPVEPGISIRPSAGPSFAQSRAVRELYLARLAKLEYERQAGKLLKADEVQNALAIIVRDTRDRLLALPDRLAEAVAVETGRGEQPAEPGGPRNAAGTLDGHAKPHGDRRCSEGKVGGRLVRGRVRLRRRRQRWRTMEHTGTVE